jgi:hypothetical protein
MKDLINISIFVEALPSLRVDSSNKKSGGFGTRRFLNSYLATGHCQALWLISD